MGEEVPKKNENELNIIYSSHFIQETHNCELTEIDQTCHTFVKASHKAGNDSTYI